MHSEKWRRLLLPGIGVAAMAAVLLLSACGSSKTPDSNSTTDGSATVAGSATDAAGYNGVLPEPAVPKPDITLTDTSNQPFNIVKDTQGYVTLMYLGYTHCPDVCPTFMAQLGKVMKSLPANVTDKMKVVFVTTDPARDTPSVLRKWLDSFDTKFIGLTGTDAQIAQLSGMVGMPAPTKEPLPDGNYGVSHGSFIYAFDKQDNKAHLIYPEGFDDQSLKADFTKLATVGWVEPKTKG